VTPVGTRPLVVDTPWTCRTCLLFMKNHVVADTVAIAAEVRPRNGVGYHLVLRVPGQVARRRRIGGAQQPDTVEPSFARFEVGDVGADVADDRITGGFRGTDDFGDVQQTGLAVGMRDVE